MKASKQSKASEEVFVPKELERVRSDYLSEIPDDFEYPLFNGAQAIESQRHSGYRNTQRAAREVVDNAYEAGANNVWIAARRVSESERTKGQPKNTVDSIAFIDDGPGMEHVPGGHSMLRYALSWGGGSHFKNPNKIGKFGFGLPNSGINQTRRLEVYSKTVLSDNWYRGVIDINNPPAFGVVNIDEPQEALLPDYITAFLKKNKIALKSGVIVVWEKPDRLTWSTEEKLAEALRQDFSVTYRGMLDKFNLFINSQTPLKPIDPLFITPGADLYVAPDLEDFEKGGAFKSHERQLFVKGFRNTATGAQQLELLETDEDIASAKKAVASPPPGESHVVVSTLDVKIGRIPHEFLSFTRPKDGESRDSYTRGRIRKDRRGITFLRAGREIDTKDAFPKDEEGLGLGKWPLMQAYAYYYGMEVAFTPALDDVLGIGNDKQTVNPVNHFWKVLAQTGYDRMLMDENFRHAESRKRPSDADDTKVIQVAEDAAAFVDELTDQSLDLGPTDQDPVEVHKQQKEKLQKQQDEAQQKLEEEAEKVSQDTDQSAEEVIEELRARESTKRYKLTFPENGEYWFTPKRGVMTDQIEIEIPKNTRFYKELWVTLPDEGRKAILMLLQGLGRAEIKAQAAGDRKLSQVALALTHIREKSLHEWMERSSQLMAGMSAPKDEEESQE